MADEIWERYNQTREGPKEHGKEDRTAGECALWGTTENVFLLGEEKA